MFLQLICECLGPRALFLCAKTYCLWYICLRFGEQRTEQERAGSLASAPVCRASQLLPVLQQLSIRSVKVLMPRSRRLPGPPAPAGSCQAKPGAAPASTSGGHCTWGRLTPCHLAIINVLYNLRAIRRCLHALVLQVAAGLHRDRPTQRLGRTHPVLADSAAASRCIGGARSP